MTTDIAQSIPPSRRQCIPTAIAQWLRLHKPHTKAEQAAARSTISKVPRTSEARQAASSRDQPLELQAFLDSAAEGQVSSQTVLYLGYGSNMSAETFRGKRNIRPLSQVNVVVPDLSLTFDLPGIPYAEPCFGNVRYRAMPSDHSNGHQEKAPYHKDRWPKGLVGICYEVTLADYAHIIATEGGGASYKDVLVDCFALTSNPNDSVPDAPTGTALKAHTLFSPSSVIRPIHSYAQPSPRYLKLITDGAAEHNLPYEYQTFLNSIGTYNITSARQRLGQFIFLSIWGPIFAFFFIGAGNLFLDKDGRYPEWFAKFAMATFAACWGSYDDVFKVVFGDGERTIEKADEEIFGGEQYGQSEKGSLLQENWQSYKAISRSEVDVDKPS